MRCSLLQTRYFDTFRGVIRAILDWFLKKKGATADETVRAENSGILVSSGLIAGQSLMAVLLAFVVGAVIMVLTSPIITGSLNLWLWVDAYLALIQGATGIAITLNPFSIEWLGLNGIVDTLVRATPYILAGLAVGIAYFNNKLGREVAVLTAAHKILQFKPTFSAEDIEKALSLKFRVDGMKNAALLQKAGII